MKIIRFAKDCLRTMAGMNIAVLVRGLRFGLEDALKRLKSAFYVVDPLSQVETKPVTSQAVSISLCGFDVSVPPGNGMGWIYNNYPRYNSEIGRIIGATSRKYPDMVAIDIGANIGDTAAIMRGSCEARIICIEGEQSMGGVLSENVARLGNACTVHAYLGERRETRQVNIDKEGWNNTLMPAERGRGVPIEFTTLDDVVDDVDPHKIKLIKLDIEGYECRALRGARNTLLAGHPVVIFEHNREALGVTGMDGTMIFAELRDLGYRSMLVWDDLGRFLLKTSLGDLEMIQDLHDYIDYPGKQLGRIYYFDVCVFHEEDEDLAERCLITERVQRDDGKAELLVDSKIPGQPQHVGTQ